MRFVFSRSFVLGLTIVIGLGLPGCERGENSREAKPVKVGVLPEGAAKPNIIIILVDALRADRLGVHGHPGELSPTIDAIAAEGVTFEYCVAPAPWTIPSVASLFTAYYPGVHKASGYRVNKTGGKGATAAQATLSVQFTTLAEVLKANGYQTAAISANNFIQKGAGMAQGFDHVDASFAANTVRGEKVNNAAFAWLAEHREPDKPLFLYLHYMDVHGPYNAAQRFMDPLMARVQKEPNKHRLTDKQGKALRGLYLYHPPAGEAGGTASERQNPIERIEGKLDQKSLTDEQRAKLRELYRKHPPTRDVDTKRFHELKHYREYWVARYEAGVAEMDFYLVQLVEGLKEQGLWDDAYVIVMADHGEALGEHDFWDHGYSLHQTDLHVPLILRWPRVLPPGLRVDRIAGLVDVLPTLSEQLRLPAGGDYQGVSLVSHLSGSLPTGPLRRFAEANKSHLQYAIYVDRMKLIGQRVLGRQLCSAAGSRRAKAPQLFDLLPDPGERCDLAAQQPETVATLLQSLNEMIETNQTIRPEVTEGWAPVEEKLVEKLRSLGYMGDEEDAEEDETDAEPR
ncbi:MAG: sulfatase [Phycisphaerae bacterium]|nr:sulfatase [Phycisphaerae bacterium]